LGRRPSLAWRVAVDDRNEGANIMAGNPWAPLRLSSPLAPRCALSIASPRLPAPVACKASAWLVTCC
jgi:hypothetical protein